jgi:hypothetical protein
MAAWPCDAIAQSPQPPVAYHRLFENLFGPVTGAVVANGGPVLRPENYGSANVLASLISSQLVSLPTGSNAGGFSWHYDSSLGIPTRVNSFGPQVAERAQTIGRNRVNVGFTHQRFTFDRLDRSSIAVVSAGFVSATPALHLAERVSLPRADISINTVFVSYGLTSRLDVGLLLPVISASIDASLDATLRRGGPGGTIALQTSNVATVREQRLGDPVFKIKWNFMRRSTGGLALHWEAKFPSQNQLGAEGFKIQLIGSGAARGVNVHVNGGFSAYACNLKPVEICSTEIIGLFLRGGVDRAVTSKLTLATDIQSQLVKVWFFDMRTVPVGIGQNADGRPSRNDTTLSWTITGKYNVWGNLLATGTGIVSSGGGLVDRFTPIFGFDYAW